MRRGMDERRVGGIIFADVCFLPVLEAVLFYLVRLRMYVCVCGFLLFCLRCRLFLRINT